MRMTGSRWHVFMFPTLWSITWLGISHISPIGRLVTWTPLLGVEPYQWILRFSGLSGLDWITAAWASVAAEELEHIIDFSAKHLPLVEIDHHEVSRPAKRVPNHVGPLTVLLIALIGPSFIVNPLPLPPFSPSTTRLEVACILPQRSESSQLDRFFKETVRYGSSAKILLWPEAAVTFETQAEKEDALSRAQKITAQYHVWIALSFQERVSGSGSERDGLYRNGMALVGKNGLEMSYYKRRLVPSKCPWSRLPD